VRAPHVYATALVVNSKVIKIKTYDGTLQFSEFGAQDENKVLRKGNAANRQSM
jgi:hypothetical protein